MNLTINHYEMGERPDVAIPHPDFLKILGENGIRNLVSRHYDLLRESSINNLFPKDDTAFEQAKRNSSDFMIQICGGTDYFNQNRGKPMMAGRHAAFSITPESRIIWLNCYKQALLETDLPENLTISFWEYINKFSSWMVNKP